MKRRTVLRGVAGATLALPFLEMFEGKMAAAQPSFPTRLLLCYAGQAMGGDGDGSVHRFRPATTGKLSAMALPLSLQPLGGLANWSGRYKHPRLGDFVEPIRNWPGEVVDVRDHVSVVTGLKIPLQGMASANTYHHRGTVSPLLSGTSSTDATPTCHAETADVIAEKKFGSPSTLRCLVQAGNYGNGGNNDSVMSWRRNANGGLQAVGGQVSPRALFTSLFEGFKPDPKAVDTTAQQRALLRRKSVLDLVLPSAQRLNTRLGVEDKRRLAAHLDGIATLRARVKALEPDGSVGASACAVPNNPGADPPYAGGMGGDGGGFNAGQGWSDEDKRATAFIDILTTAMACNLTRTGTLMFSYTQSFLNGENPTGLRGDQHQIGHGGPVERANNSPNDSVALCHHYPVRYFGYLVGRMAGITMAAGRTLLDECATGLFFEAGHGTYEGNMNAHSGDEMACLIAGRGLKKGEHVRLPGEHPARVIATMLSAVGCDATLGDVKGTNPALLT